jgi:glycosyltransferase involved in cell wall biosynthesis
MKLLFVHQYLGALGGAEADILLTAANLRERGYDLGLLFAAETGRNPAPWHEAFSECFPLAERGKGSIVRAVLDKVRPDLIYLNSMSDLETLEALFASGVPVIRRVHDHGMYCMRGYKYNYFTRNICTRPAGLHCVFPCMAFAGRNRGGAFPVKWVSYAAKRKEIRLNRQSHRLIVYSLYQKEELVRNGFDRNRIDIHVPIRCWGTTGPVCSLSDRNLVLFAGQIIRGKGVDLLLRALARVTVRFEGLILGDGNHRADCERLCARLGLSGRVEFRGYIPHSQLKEFLLEASLLAVPSVWPEPFALIGQEAMRYGLPVVAFDAGGIREWLKDGENGFLVPWMDTVRLAARIEELLRDKALARRLGRRGMELVNAEYDASKQIDALERIFAQAARGTRNSFGEPAAPEPASFPL